MLCFFVSVIICYYNHRNFWYLCEKHFEGSCGTMRQDINYLLEHFDEEMENFSISSLLAIRNGGLSYAVNTSMIFRAVMVPPNPLKDAAQGLKKAADKAKNILSNSQNEKLSTTASQFTDEKGEFYNKILEICTKKGLDEVEVYKKANISRSIFSKIRSMNRTDYVPSKPTVICICLSLGLNLQETQIMLNYVGYSLSDKMLVDKIIAWAIEHNIFNIFDIDFCIHNKTGKSYLLQT